MAGHAAEQAKAFTAGQTEFKTLLEKHDQLSTDFANLLARLDKTVDHNQQTRPTANGGDGTVLATY